MTVSKLFIVICSRTESESVHTHAHASQVTLERIARQVSVWGGQTAAAIYI